MFNKSIGKDPIYSLQNQFTISSDKKTVTFFLHGKEKTITALNNIRGWIESKLGWSTFIPTDPQNPKKGFYVRQIALENVLNENQPCNLNSQHKIDSHGTNNDSKKNNIKELFTEAVFLEAVALEPTQLKSNNLHHLANNKDFMIKLIEKNPKAIFQIDPSLVDSNLISSISPATLKFIPEQTWLDAMKAHPEIFDQLDPHLKQNKDILAQHFIAHPKALKQFQQLTGTLPFKDQKDIFTLFLKDQKKTNVLAKRMDVRRIINWCKDQTCLNIMVNMYSTKQNTLIKGLFSDHPSKK